MKYVSKIDNGTVTVFDTGTGVETAYTREDVKNLSRGGEIYGVNVTDDLVYSLVYTGDGKKFCKDDLVYGGEYSRDACRKYFYASLSPSFTVQNGEFINKGGIVYYDKASGKYVFERKLLGFPETFTVNPKFNLYNEDGSLFEGGLGSEDTWLAEIYSGFRIELPLEMARYSDISGRADAAAELCLQIKPVLERDFPYISLKTTRKERAEFMRQNEYAYYTDEDTGETFLGGKYINSDIIKAINRGSYFDINPYVEPDRRAFKYLDVYGIKKFRVGVFNFSSPSLWCCRVVNKRGCFYRIVSGGRDDCSLGYYKDVKDFFAFAYYDVNMCLNGGILEIEGLDGVYRYDERAYDDWKKERGSMSKIELTARLLGGRGMYNMTEKGELLGLTAGRTNEMIIPKGCKKIRKGAVVLPDGCTLRIGSEVEKCEKGGVITSKYFSKDVTFDLNGVKYTAVYGVLSGVYSAYILGLGGSAWFEILCGAVMAGRIDFYKNKGSCTVTQKNEVGGLFRNGDTAVKVLEYVYADCKKRKIKGDNCRYTMRRITQNFIGFDNLRKLNRELYDWLEIDKNRKYM